VANALIMREKVFFELLGLKKICAAVAGDEVQKRTDGVSTRGDEIEHIPFVRRSDHGDAGAMFAFRENRLDADKPTEVAEALRECARFTSLVLCVDGTCPRFRDWVVFPHADERGFTRISWPAVARVKSEGGCGRLKQYLGRVDRLPQDAGGIRFEGAV
jgi:hypothetical protein